MDVTETKLTKSQWEAVYYVLEGALWLYATKQHMDKESEKKSKEV